MNTLTGIEAERVNQILLHALDRLKILTVIPRHYDDDVLSELSNQVIKNSLQKQWQAEEQLRSVNFAGEVDFSLIKQCHKSVRATCRNLQVDRQSLQLLMNKPEIDNEFDENNDINGIIKYLNELRQQVLSRMTTTVEDDAAHRSLLQELNEKERHLEESREVLQKKLDEVIEEKDKVTFTLDQTLRKLRTEKEDIMQFNAIELDSINKEMNDTIAKAKETHLSNMKQLQEQVEAMEKQLAEVADRNSEEETKLRKDKSRAENALSAKIALYDQEMNNKSNLLQELNENYTKELAEYAILKKHFDEVNENTTRISREESILSAVHRRKMLGKFAMESSAATIIQKYVRGKLAREAYRKLKKGKKKGKKGKGKGKKGK